MELAQVQQLKQKIDDTNNKLVYAKAQVESARQRQNEILKQYNCSSIEDLKKLKETKEQELTNLINAAQSYIAEVQPILNQVSELNNGY